MIRLRLIERDVNLLLSRLSGLEASYRQGCFVVYQRLALGGANFVAVPAQSGQELWLTLPFDQIRGDITGGFMGALAKMLWGFVQGEVEKRLTPQLVRSGFPSDTVSVEKIDKAGRVRISLRRVNEWLARQPVPLSVVGLRFDAEGLAVDLEVP